MDDDDQTFAGKKPDATAQPGKTEADPYIPIDNQVYTFHSIGEQISIDEVYHVSPSSPLTVNNCGSWRNLEGLRLTSLTILQRRQNFQGHLFRAETVFNPLFSPKKEGAKIGGILGDIWHNVLEQVLNFTTIVKPSMDKQYGALGKDAKWSGVIGALVEDRTDVGLAGFFITESRGKAVFFSPGLDTVATRFFIQLPGLETNWLTFLEPFSTLLWISLLCLLFTISTLLTLAYLLGREKRLSPGSFSPQNSWMTIWGSWMAQGSWLEPKSIPTRIMFLLSFLCGITIYTAYSAKLISFLSVPKVALPFTSLEELLPSREFSVGMLKGTAEHESFANALPGSPRNRVAEQLMSKEDLVESDQEGWARLRKNPKYTFISNSNNLPNNAGCDFLEMPFDLDVNIVAIAWNPRLPHRHILNYALAKMIESGQVKRILKKWLTKKQPDCWDNGRFKSMDMEHTVSAFALVFAASSISLILLFFEVMSILICTVQSMHAYDNRIKQMCEILLISIDINLFP